MKCIQNKKSGMTKYLIPLWNMAYSGAKSYGVIKNLLWMCYAASDFLTIILLQKVYDALMIKEGGKNFVIQVVLFGTVLLINEILLAATNVVTEDSCYLMMQNLGNRLHKKADGFEALQFEEDEFLNRIQQARCGVESGTFMLNVLSMVGFYHVPYLLMVCIYLIQNQPVLVLTLFLIAIPVILNQWIKGKEYEKIVENSSALEREYLYYEKCISDVEYFKETRLLRAFRYFHKLYRDTISCYNRLKLKTAGKMCKIGMVMQVISLMGYIGTIVLLIVQVCKGNIPVSAFFAIFTSFSSVFSMVENLIGYYIGQISEQSGSVRYLMDFLTMPEMEGKKRVFDEAVEEISLKKVTFCYPNTEKPIIRNVSCTFSNKETVAIVGENGAGKTTLVKLLAGLYVPQEGAVAYNGKDIADYERSSLWSKMSSVFQNFQRYKMTLEDNIFPGGNVNEEKAKHNLQRVGLPLDGGLFPNGQATILSKEFGGVDLSGGQWQKLAIVRGMNKEHEILFLDEPTSAIDPQEETKLYQLFTEMSADCLSFIVTHRLGICKIVDRIIVLDKGELVECGTHEELLEKRGKYFEMYKNQAGLYENFC